MSRPRRQASYAGCSSVSVAALCFAMAAPHPAFAGWEMVPIAPTPATATAPPPPAPSATAAPPPPPVASAAPAPPPAAPAAKTDAPPDQKAEASGTKPAMPLTAAETEAAKRFQSANDEWNKGDLERAETIFKECIEKGSLSPEAVVSSWVHLGALRSILGRKKALEAFRAAAVLRREFELPQEAGKKEQALAEQARKDTDGVGAILLTLDAPDTIGPGGSANLVVHLDAPHLAVAKKFVFRAHEAMYNKDAADERAIAERAEFSTSATLAAPGARIVVRVDALDPFGNRLASVERIINVPDNRPKAGTGGGFWSSPWPYVIGGAILAGGGAAGYYFLRPPDTVPVQSITITR